MVQVIPEMHVKVKDFNQSGDSVGTAAIQPSELDRNVHDQFNVRVGRSALFLSITGLYNGNSYRHCVATPFLSLSSSRSDFATRIGKITMIPISDDQQSTTPLVSTKSSTM